MKKHILLMVTNILTVLVLQAQAQTTTTSAQQQSLTPVASTPTQDTDEVFKVVEEPPIFLGCENVEGKSERIKCSDRKMLEFLYGKLKYPTDARKNNVQGIVYISFIVEKDGRVTNPQIVEDIGYGCGETILQIVKSFPTWEPGRQRGTPVRVYKKIPVKFSLK
ncbi:MAG: energy transducer TonB [Saprospiraceae bacterium]|nr:energy transducer TonB [Saprospiraceae bacterium]